MTITDTAASGAKLELALPGPEHLAALATIEPELWALDGASVERPLGNPAELARSIAGAEHDAPFRQVGS